jgi:hypothetical protein
MIELKDWIETVKLPNKPWLVLGKGPSFSARGEFDLSKFNTLGLNHVVRGEKVTCAHIIDIDVVEACQETLLTNCDWLIIPRVPHVRCFASEYMNLKDWLQCMPILAEAEKLGKLVTYSLAHLIDRQNPWTIEAKYFSSEVAFGILGRMKVKQVSLLGIDGGSSYSSVFQDLNENTLLINKQPNFDLQFQQLARIAAQYGIEYSHLVKEVADKIPPCDATTSAHTESKEQLAEDDAEIILPAIGAFKIASTNLKSETDAEFTALPRAIEYAAAYIYRRKVFPKAKVSGNEKQSAAEKIQVLENDLRLYRERLEETLEELARVSKDLVVCHQRLGWSRKELDEYRARAEDLEKTLQRMVRSASWKVGRVLTKPAEIIGKTIAKPGSDDRT